MRQAARDRDGPRAPGLTLRRAASLFSRQPSARVISAVLLAAIEVRMILGNIGWSDLLVMGILLAFQPFVEWCIHVFVLHFEPRTWRGRTIDFTMARDHRSHHREPHNPRYWCIPLASGLRGLVLAGLLAMVVMPRLDLAVTALATVVALALAYEWTHYLCHSSYRPKSRFYRRIWRYHRLHHFKNEHYWMGVTRHAADWVLHTLPRAQDVELSPTCRNLDDRD